MVPAEGASHSALGEPGNYSRAWFPWAQVSFGPGPASVPSTGEYESQVLRAAHRTHSSASAQVIRADSAPVVYLDPRPASGGELGSCSFPPSPGAAKALVPSRSGWVWAPAPPLRGEWRPQAASEWLIPCSGTTFPSSSQVAGGADQPSFPKS